ncbi:MAG: bacillithiol biosynthesis BshC, partial [Mucilaginibacter sp.]|nr:bacillithiol biosynthesis BshC [Mucilaginibacter sp.]
MIGALTKSEILNSKSEIKLMDAACISYKETGYFSQTVTDYLEDKPELRPFYSNRPDWDGFKALLKNKKVIGNRALLAQVLTKQYQSIPESDSRNYPSVKNNTDLLKSENTYTI